MIALFVILGVLSCTSNYDDKHPNFLIIDIDSLRADYVVPEYQSRTLAPNLSKIAGKGVLFENAVSQAAWTLPSLASLLTGRLPPAIEVEKEKASWLDPKINTLPEILQFYGYTNASFYNYSLPTEYSPLNRGFEKYGLEKKPIKGDYYSEVCSWLESDPKEPFMALVHNIDLHSPELPPSFYDEWLGYRLPLYNQNLDMFFNGAIKKVGEEEAKKLVKDLYAANLSWYDKEIGKIVKCYEEADLANNTIIVITSNHGEDLFDHNILGHGMIHYQSVLNVPLIIYDKNRSSHKISQFVQTIDLAPTILELASIPSSQMMDGDSLVSLLDNPDSTIPERDIVSFSSFRAASLIKDNRKIVFQRKEPDDHKVADISLEYMAPETTVLLFDLSKDPSEQRNIYFQGNEISMLMQKDLLGYIETIIKRTRNDKDIDVNDSFIKALKEGGYWEHVQKKGK